MHLVKASEVSLGMNKPEMETARRIWFIPQAALLSAFDPSDTFQTLRPGHLLNEVPARKSLHDSPRRPLSDRSEWVTNEGAISAPTSVPSRRLGRIASYDELRISS